MIWKPIPVNDPRATMLCYPSIWRIRFINFVDNSCLRIESRVHQLGTNQMASLLGMVPLHSDITFSKHLWSSSQVQWLFFSFTNPLYLLSFNCSCFSLPFDLFLVNLNLFLDLFSFSLFCFSCFSCFYLSYC